MGQRSFDLLLPFEFIVISRISVCPKKSNWGHTHPLHTPGQRPGCMHCYFARATRRDELQMGQYKHVKEPAKVVFAEEAMAGGAMMQAACTQEG